MDINKPTSKQQRTRIRQERVPEVFRFWLERYAESTIKSDSDCIGMFKFCPETWTYTFCKDKLGKKYLTA